MKRREFIGKVGLGVAAAGALIPSRASAKEKTFKWKVVTSWPPRSPVLQGSVERLAKNIETMSGGRIKMQTFAGGELVGPFDVFDAVSQGKAVQAGSTAAYYFAGKVPEAQFFSAMPFGLTHREMVAWMYSGGGLDLFREVYKPFNMIPFPMLSTGTQMGGWFRKEINSIADLKGLRMRIPGLGGKIMAKVGVNVVNLPGAEVFTSLERGVIDAAEWANPMLDMRIGLQKAAKYYYGPGSHEPTTFVDLIVNLKAWESLPLDLKAIVETAAVESLNWSIATMDVRNGPLMHELIEKHGVKIRMYPDDVIEALRKATQETLEEVSNKNPKLRKIYDAVRKFQADIKPWMKASEWAYIKATGF